MINGREKGSKLGLFNYVASWILLIMCGPASLVATWFVFLIPGAIKFYYDNALPESVTLLYDIT